MIRIRFKSEKEYLSLQQKYLSQVAKFVEFDKSDILDEATEPLKTAESKTERTAKKLQEGYPELYHFLFKEGQLNKENLRMLLVGPKDMPASFGGTGKHFQTMREFLEWISRECKPNDIITARKICKKIFCYKNGFGSSDEAYSILRSLNVRVCPYCNRIYTITLPSKEELRPGRKPKKTRPTFDHFYYQSEYPFLALNLFNLVPSCHTCNLNKGTAKAEIIYPYDEAFEKKAVFRVIPQIEEIINEDCNPFAFLMGESDLFSIRFMGNNGSSLLGDSRLSYRLFDIEDKNIRKRIEKSIQLFCLEEQYDEHKMEIRDILKNKYYFNEQYVRSVICPMLQEKMRKNGLGEISEEQIMDMAMDMIFFSRINQEKWGERPLSKLTADILEQVSIKENYLN